MANKRSREYENMDLNQPAEDQFNSPLIPIEVENEAANLTQQYQTSTLNRIWEKHILNINNSDAQSEEIRNHSFPLARTRRIMKSDENVKMVSGETPVLFAKACELFLQELTLRSWLQTEDNLRRTLQRRDVAESVRQHAALNFLEHRVALDSRDQIQDHGDPEAVAPTRMSGPIPGNLQQNEDVQQISRSIINLNFPLFDINEDYVMNPEGFAEYVNPMLATNGNNNNASSSK